MLVHVGSDGRIDRSARARRPPVPTGGVEGEEVLTGRAVEIEAGAVNGVHRVGQRERLLVKLRMVAGDVHVARLQDSANPAAGELAT